MGGGASFRGGLENVAEDEVAAEDAEAAADDFDNDSPSRSSGDGGVVPPCRTPPYAPGMRREEKKGGPLPARRLSMGGGSADAKGGGMSFRGGLENVTEDEEADADEEADDPEGRRSIEVAPRRRRRTLPARRRRARSLLGTGNGELFRSCSSRRLAKGSANAMDFGVDPFGGRFARARRRSKFLAARVLAVGVVLPAFLRALVALHGVAEVRGADGAAHVQRDADVGGGLADGGGSVALEARGRGPC